jgi:hypothetical protein
VLAVLLLLQLNDNFNVMKTILIIIVLIGSCVIYSQDSTKLDAQQLAQQASNPLTSVYSLPFQNNTTFGDPITNQLLIQPVAPISLKNKINLIVRPIFSIETRQYNTVPASSERETCFGNIILQTFFSNYNSIKLGNANLTLGIGPSVVFPTNTFEFSKGAFDDDWQLGFGSVFVFQFKGLMAGALVNPNWILSNTYTGNDNVSLTIQPFITYTFKTGTAISMSPLMNGNFIADAWLVPVGLGVSQLLKLGIPMNLSVQGFYNAVKPTADYGDWSLRCQLTLLFPKSMFKKKK